MKINFLELQIFTLIIILQSFYKISSLSSFDYPYSIILSNDNIFLIQKTGIDIYDKSLNKLNQIIEFSGEEEITEENFLKIAIKYNKEYILSVINDKMFIFNNEGKLLYKSEEKIDNNQTIYSYSLTFIQETNNTYDYVIGYFDGEYFLNLNLYRYDIETNNISLLYQYRKNSYKYQINNYYQTSIFEFTYEQKLLSCEYMLVYSILMFPNYMNLLVCFFNSNSTVGIVVYNIIDNYIDNIEIIQYQGLFNNTLFISSQNIDNVTNIASIKSELNNDRKQAIIWWNAEGDNQTRYFIYNLDYMINLYSLKIPNACINSKYEPRITLFN
jgi:hypothetical protein